MKWLLIFAALALSGCAYLHGIARVAPANSFPPPQAVVDALQTIPEVKHVYHFTHDGRAPIDRLLGTSEGSIDEFAIHGDKIGFSMQFWTLPEKKGVTLQMSRHESRPASFRIAEVRDFMRTVYSALSLRFPELPRDPTFSESVVGLELESQ